MLSTPLMVTAEDVNAESLQAQIDVSMSFAHNLVTSWIKPSHFAQSRSSGVNATQILEEELRRPPRLGVGASIPAIPPLAHEASKLKRKLGKNGANHEGVVESQPQDISDEEEHKGRPAKRKTKVDPFGHEGDKKRRKADLETNPYPKHPVPLLGVTTLSGGIMHKLLSSNERQQTGPSNQCLTVPTVPLLLAPSRVISGRAITPESSRVHSNSMPMPDKANLLGIPLLNLDGPVGFADNNDIGLKPNNSKRKRKRRKKKKKAHNSH